MSTRPAHALVVDAARPRGARLPDVAPALDENQLRWWRPDVGGGFAPSFMYPEEVTLAAACCCCGGDQRVEDRRRLSRAVQERIQYWTSSRPRRRRPAPRCARHDPRQAPTPARHQPPYTPRPPCPAPYMLPPTGSTAHRRDQQGRDHAGARAGLSEGAFRWNACSTASPTSSRFIARKCAAQPRAAEKCPTSRDEDPLRSPVASTAATFSGCQRRALATIDHAGFAERSAALG